MSGANGRLINPLIAPGQSDTRAVLETRLAKGAGGLFSPPPRSDTAPAAPDAFGPD